MLLPARAIVKVRCIVLLPSSFLWQVLGKSAIQSFSVLLQVMLKL